jgi:hypothetical protein
MTELHQVVEPLLISIPERLKQDQGAATIQVVVGDAERNLRKWIVWPECPLLLWEDCVRPPAMLPTQWIRRGNGRAWNYVYPPLLDSLLRQMGIKPDLRMNNGPPQTTLQLARRGVPAPKGFEHHHLYDGVPDDWHKGERRCTAACSQSPVALHAIRGYRRDHS